MAVTVTKLQCVGEISTLNHVTCANCAYCELNNSISSAIMISYFFLRSNDVILPKRRDSLYIIIKPSYTAIALSTWLTHRCILVSASGGAKSVCHFNEIDSSH